MTWPSPSDIEIGKDITLPDERAQVSAALLGKYRECDRRLVHPFQIPSSFTATLSTSPSYSALKDTDWQTVKSIVLKPPSHLRGDAGSRLSFYLYLKIASAGLPLASQAMARFYVVGNQTIYSDENGVNYPSVGGPTLYTENYITLTADGLWMYPHVMGPAEVTVNFQLRIVREFAGDFIAGRARTATLEALRTYGPVHRIMALPL